MFACSLRYRLDEEAAFLGADAGQQIARSRTHPGAIRSRADQPAGHGDLRHLWPSPSMSAPLGNLRSSLVYELK